MRGSSKAQWWSLVLLWGGFCRCVFLKTIFPKVSPESLEEFITKKKIQYMRMSRGSGF